MRSTACCTCVGLTIEPTAASAPCTAAKTTFLPPSASAPFLPFRLPAPSSAAAARGGGPGGRGTEPPDEPLLGHRRHFHGRARFAGVFDAHVLAARLLPHAPHRHPDPARKVRLRRSHAPARQRPHLRDRRLPAVLEHPRPHRRPPAVP